jgi:deoxyribodipyrimidine photolyase-related protein
MTTKPYISGSAYINRMSDYCGQCQFDPKQNCPITNLYWAFLNRHRQLLEKNNRMQPILKGLAKRGEKKQRADTRIFRIVSSHLKAGKCLAPDSFENRNPTENGK